MSTPTEVARPVPGYRDWRDDAACRDVDPELFFPDGDVKSVRAQVTMAKLTCRRCPVSATCLSWALASGQEAGIWGGLTEAERHRLLRRTRPGSTAPFRSAASAPVWRATPASSP
jgi:WhiB family redox-sensing transcriptional regulator